MHSRRLKNALLTSQHVSFIRMVSTAECVYKLNGTVLSFLTSSRMNAAITVVFPVLGITRISA